MTLQKLYITSAIAKGTRLDGRKLDEFRQVTIETGVIHKAEGSARVHIGKSDVLVGVKLAVGTPFPDKQDEGVLIVGAELSPIASPHFESGPPGEESIELARVVDRGIRESHAVDMKKLCIIPGEKVWMINIDIHILNHDGNLIDAASLGAIAALKSAHMLGYDAEKKVIQYDVKGGPLPLARTPIAISVVKVGNSLLVDPTFEEEEVMGTRLVVSTTEDGNLCALQKGGTIPLQFDEVDKAFQLSLEKGAELRELIEPAVKRKGKLF